VRVCALEERINPHKHAWRHGGNGFDSHRPLQIPPALQTAQTAGIGRVVLPVTPPEPPVSDYPALTQKGDFGVIG
jgi:hypothetical protein